VAAHPRALLYTTYVDQAEILYGIGALPEGRCIFRGKSAGDSGMKSATDSDLISAIPI
jgi:hypothetical protein